MRRVIEIACALVAVGWAPGSLAAARVDPPASIVSGELGAKLDEAVRKDPAFWGAVLVARGDEILLAKGYGEANAKHDPITIRHYFDIGSVTKQFTACAILRLEMQGKLSIEDSIGKHLKAFAPDDDVTIRHLMTHTSGWPGDAKLEPEYRATREGLARAFSKAPRVREPGAGFEYQNQCYGLLAAIVEEVSGEKYEAFVNRELFELAGMRDTGFIPGIDLDKARETKREFGGVKRTTFQYYWDWDLRGCGGILTTISDFYKWDRALRTDVILDEARKKEFYTPALSNYALGVNVESDGDGGRTAEHSGGTRGYRAEYIRWLEKDVQIAVFTSSSADPMAVSKRLTSAVFGMEEASVRARMMLGKQQKNENGMVALGERARWDVARGEKGSLTLSLRDGDDTRLVVEMKKAAAMDFLKELRSAIAEQPRKPAQPGQKGEAGRRAGEADAPPKRALEGGLYTNPYKAGVGEDGVLALPDGIVVQVLARYQSEDESGKRAVDERVTLILMDETKHFWPVVVKMSNEGAAGLERDVAKVGEGKGEEGR